MDRSIDVAVVGAGVFGAWIAHDLCETGRSVVLVDSFGPGNARAASGGESRVLRIGYGGAEIYSRWALRSLPRWKQVFSEADESLFVPTGVLWFGREDDPRTDATIATLQRLQVPFDLLSPSDLASRFPQFHRGSVARAVLEPESGIIWARRAVQMVVRQAVRRGTELIRGTVVAPTPSKSRLEELATSSGGPNDKVRAAAFVFACGAWLPTMFPHLLGRLIQPTRQEVFFFGLPFGDLQLSAPRMPTWVDFHEGVYGLPDIGGCGLKIGLHQHGPPFDPSNGDRLPSPEALSHARQLATARIPLLGGAPLLDARVCQYANTASGDFLIDRHPDFDNVWVVGGGSGHGFKHGPAVGEYVTALLDGDGEVESRFSLAAKRTARTQEIY